ncbi:uncharacterized protein LOC107797985 [Nicotiana tabacum]|uniref:Uncharacterized protein LOC107797985 n=1 Tax=Nicotiana tabacum TaxID=4097 RepID=A0A1S4AIF0_TOBAC
MTITRFFKAIPTPPSSGTSSPLPSTSPCLIIHDNIKPSTELNKDEILNLDLKPDFVERKQISEYSLNLRDRVRRDDELKKVVLEKAPRNNMMIAPNIQKEIVNACAKETMKAIIEEMNGDYFGILVDESKDVSHKEQMAIAIYSLLLKHSLSRSQIRGQGYDGVSNIQGEINGLKTLILKDTPSAYCVHCFARQLQLTFVAVAKKHYDVDQFSDIVANVLNNIRSSFKHREMLREDQAQKLEELLMLGEVDTGSGQNQEFGLQRPGDTRWGSHFKIVHNFIVLFSSIIHVLEV